MRTENTTAQSTHRRRANRLAQTAILRRRKSNPPSPRHDLKTVNLPIRRCKSNPPSHRAHDTSLTPASNRGLQLARADNPREPIAPLRVYNSGSSRNALHCGVVMSPFHFRRSRRIALGSLVFFLLFTTSAPALIMVGKGNKPVTDAGWPTGALELANLKTRVGWFEGPPFGGGEWCFMYRGDMNALNEALKALGAVRAPALQVVLHDGTQENPFLRDDKDPKADASYDWSFTVWVPANWHHLYNDPRSTFSADSEHFRKPVDAPRLDVYISAKLDWTKAVVPEGVQVIDQRAAAGAKPAAGAVIRGDVFDMGTGKPLPNAEVRVEIYKTPQNTYEKAASATSNNDGRFEVANVPPGHCRVIASATGYAARMIGYEEFKDGAARKFAIELSKAAKLSGIVTDPDGKPLAGVTVRVNNTMGIDGRGYTLPDALQTQSDDKGQYTLAGLPTGYGQVWAYSKGWYQLDILKLHAVPEDNGVAVQMVATGTIKGTVLDAKGKPSGNGTISVNPPGDPIGKWGGSMNLAADGSFQFDNVPPGPYTISTKPQFPGMPADPDAQQIAVTSGKTVDVTVKK